MNSFLSIDPAQEKNKVTDFLKSIFEKTKINHAAIGLSGGIDSATSLYLLREVLPLENIFVTHLFYFENSKDAYYDALKNINIPEKNLLLYSIKPMVDPILEHLKITPDNEENKLRIGNIMARIRMITLFDLAKKYNTLVCGTENKSEHHLGYFTRFGDAASDIEPISHLYKTQVYELAKYLGVPDETIARAPTAGLWDGQTDEGELGFTYAEADAVLHLYFDKKMSLEEIEKDYKNAGKIIEKAKANMFKQEVPYIIK